MNQRLLAEIGRTQRLEIINSLKRTKGMSVNELVGKDRDNQSTTGFSIGSDRAMFGVDYPHFETIFPNTKNQIAKLAGDPSVTEEDARKILYKNAATVYGFDLTALQPDIDRIGVDLTDTLAAV